MDVDWSYSWLFFLLLIPIIIHFLNFVRTKQVYFSKIQFITYVKDQRNKVDSIKRLLLLIVRCLVFLALIISFFKIYKTEEGGAKKKIIFLDNTLSMSTKLEGNSSSLDLAINYISNEQKNKEEIALNTSRLEKSGLYFSKSDLVDKLSTIAVNERSLAFSEVLSRTSSIISFSELKNEEVEVVVVSDFQKNINLPEAIESPFSLRLVKIGNKESLPNFIVDSIWLSTRYLKSNQKEELKVRYKVLRSKNSISLKLLVNGLQTSFVNDIQEQEGVLTLPIEATVSGVNTCKLIIEDETTFDNQFLFTVVADKSIKVGVVSNDTSSSYVLKVFKNESLFDTKGWLANEVSFDELTAFDLLVFDGVSTDFKGISTVLDQLMQMKKLMCYVPSLEVNNDFELDDWFLKRLKGKAVQDSIKHKIDQFDEEYMASVFEGKKKSYDSPKAIRQIEYGKAGRNLFEFDDNMGFLVQQGDVYGFSSSFKESVSSFQKHSLFVPVFYKMAFSAINYNETLAYRVSNEIILDLKIAPEEQLVFEKNNELFDVDFVVNEVGKVVITKVPDNLNAGLYNVFVKDSLITTIAINSRENESITEFYSEEDIKGKFIGENAVVSSINNSNDVNDYISGNSEGMPFWKYSLTLALLLLLVEIIVIKYWR